jgi:hypothetical protein
LIFLFDIGTVPTVWYFFEGSLSLIFLFDIGTVPTVWYVF